MTIDRLSSLSAQFAALRAELSKKSGESRRKARADDTREASSAPTDGKRESESLRRQLATLVQGVNIDDEDALMHVRKRVVKAILLWEFGASLREHPEWQPMIDRVADALTGDEHFRRVFNRLIDDLQQ